MLKVDPASSAGISDSSTGRPHFKGWFNLERLFVFSKNRLRIFFFVLGYFQIKSNAGNPKLNLAPNGTIQSITDFGTKGFGGACPPKGNEEHPYIFTVYEQSSLEQSNSKV